MLDNFREIYNKELKLYRYENKLLNLILDSQTIRAFVYEVCKECVTKAVNDQRLQNKHL